MPDAESLYLLKSLAIERERLFDLMRALWGYNRVKESRTGIDLRTDPSGWSYHNYVEADLTESMLVDRVEIPER